MDYRTVQILLVEDDTVAQMAVRRSFQKLKIGNPIHAVEDGVAALQVLRGEGGIPKLARPFIILLDLNLPRMDGHEFLRALRSDPDLSDCVVFVLTTSEDEKDRLAAYRMNVAGYIVKSNAGPDFIHAVSMIDHYWRVVELP